MDNNLKKENPIGIFDSGIGGLTVAHAIKTHLPKEQLVYFGDTAHLPYGDKEPYSIKHYSVEIAKFLLERKCKLIVIACHTASSIAYKEVKRIVGNQAIVVNVVDPVVQLLAKINKSNAVGVIGTKGTIKSDVYRKRIADENATLFVKSLATPLLCPMIEEGFIDDKISQTVIDSYLSDERLSDIEHIILACTHYPLIKKQISSYYSDRVNVIDSAEVVAQHVAKLLDSKNLLSEIQRYPHHFFVSDYTKSFEKSTRFFFKEKIKLEKGSIWS
ncbi:MAG: glutamate racemase [Vicingaceae bacterium]